MPETEMIYEIEPVNPDLIAPLFEPLDYNLMITSILAGLTPGRVFVDHPERPEAGLIFFGHHLFAAGSNPNRQFWKNLGSLVRESILPEAFGPRDILMLHMPSQEWDERADKILPGLFPVQRERKAFECTRLVQPWRDLLPQGFILQMVDQELLSQGLDHTDYLQEELCSERPSIDDFFQKSFGLCILTGRELAAWCLSEYNTGERCEVGVATVEKYQRRGLGTITTLALVEHALSHGIRRIGWHCWSKNLASVALAQRAGFELLQEYKVHLCVLDLAVQFGLHASDHHTAGEWDEAAGWYQKAIDHGGAPAWLHAGYAGCQARLGENDAAMKSLLAALELGFDDLDRLRSDPDLLLLRDHPDWPKYLS